MTRFALALLWLAALLLPAAAQAEERILSFHSDLAVQPRGDLLVTETITVRAEGDRIRRGIYRDFPTRYPTANGGRMRVEFDLLGVTRNGEPEPAAVEPVDNGVRIRIGREEVLIPPGDHRYVIRYRTDRQLGRFDDYDELYWNVTGNGWVFPIDEARARIALPSPATFGERAVYTGPRGATEKQARVVEERPGEIVFATTAPLAPYEGFTIAVAWPKGVVAAISASASDRQRWWLADYGPFVVGALGLAGVIAFLFYAWKRAGRDPRPGTVVPLFSPPDELSPAAMRYVWKMNADNRAFAAALVDLGVKGHVRIVEEDGGWFSGDKRRIERHASPAPLAAAEEAMLRELAMTGESILMDNEHHAKFSAARKALDKDFKKRFEGKLFHRNWGWALAAVLVWLAAIWATSAAIAAATGTIDVRMVIVGLGAIGAATLFSLLLTDASARGKCLYGLAAAGFALLAVVTAGPIFAAAINSGWLLPLALPVLGLPMALSAFWWMSAPTQEGRAVLDRIAGYRQYLSIAEGERLDRMTQPEDTPEIFERYLPYAIALGVENRWADRFRNVLAAAAVAPGSSQGFRWYSGSGNPWGDPDGFVDSVGSSLSSSVSSASTAPGSSSGSGGGGSSGGGGGGGGGGGW